MDLDYYLKAFGKCNSIDEIDNWIDETFPKKQKTLRGDAFEVFAIFYLLHSDEWSSITHQAWTTDRKDFGERIPFSIAQKLGIERDDGIDLLLQCVEEIGHYYDVQVKWRRDPTAKLSWGKMATFDASAGRAKSLNSDLIHKHIVFTNVWEVDRKYIEHPDYLVICRKDILYSKHIFAKIKALSSGIPPEKVIIPDKPRPYQQEAINKSLEHYRTKNRGQLIFPCGSGKTFTSDKIAEKLSLLFRDPSSPVLWCILPTLDIVAQHYRSFMRHYPKHGDRIWNCLFVASNIAEKKKSGSQPFSISTKPEELERWMRKYHDRPQVIFSTYASANTFWTSVQKEKVHIDLCIIDEAHMTVGSKLGRMGNIIKEDNPFISKHLFLTATPKTVKVIKGELDMVHCMSDERVYGSIIHSVSYRWLVNQGYLSDYTVDFILDSAIEYEPEKCVLAGANGQITTSALATVSLLKQKFDQNEITHCIAFTNINKDAKVLEEVSKILFKDTNIKVFRVYGEMKPSMRERIYQEYQSTERAIVFNAQLLYQSIDFPVTDGIAICRNMHSVTNIIQTVLRGDRILRSEGGRVLKNHFRIIIPCIITNEEEFVNETGDFVTVRRVISALAEEDEELREEWLAEVGSGNSHTYTGKRRIKIGCGKILERVDVNEWTKHFAVQSLSSNKISIINWRRKFLLYKEYVITKGQEPKRITEYKGVKIGTWKQSQIKSYNEGRMPALRSELLETIPGWSWVIPEKVLNYESRILEVCKPYLEGDSITNVIQLRGGIKVQIIADRPDLIQLSLQPVKTGKEMIVWRKTDKCKQPSSITDLFEEEIASKKIFNGKIPPFLLKKGFSYKEWLNLKVSPDSDFKDCDIECSPDIARKLYLAKGCHYIQLKKYGLYRLGDDVFGKGVPILQCPQVFRIRCKSHSPGYSVTASLRTPKPKRSSYSLEDPKCLALLLE